MKTLGLIGGTTWLSTVEYYRSINQAVNARLGALHSAKLAQKIECVALLGTKPTMELEFFKARLEKRGIKTLVPDAPDREIIHASIFAELGKEIFKPETRAEYVRIIDGLAERGARGVILGCTEIPLLVRPGDCRIPTFDTTALHVGAAVKFALGGAPAH